MARLIDADKLMDETVWKIGGDPFDQYYMGYQDALDNVEATIDAQDTVDAVEVVHGRWLYDSGSGKHFCSACDEFALSFKKDRWAVGELYETFLTDYCPNCGAKMDLEVDNA